MGSLGEKMGSLEQRGFNFDTQFEFSHNRSPSTLHDSLKDIDLSVYILDFKGSVLEFWLDVLMN